MGRRECGGNWVWERVGGERDREKERGEGVKGDMDDESGGKGKGRWLDGGMGDK